MSEPPPPEAIPAATLVILREWAGAVPELLMVERAPTLAFAAGALVFPGGRLEPGDAALAARLGHPDDADRTARVAAIRETIEEAGLPIGLVPRPSAAAFAQMRAVLAAGGAFADALATAGVTLDLDTLVPFARWRPAIRVERIFDTRFYLTRAAVDLPAASVDQTENTRLCWAGAADVLAAASRGEAKLIYPTRRNLERLATFAHFADAVADAQRHPMTIITPAVERRDGVDQLCIPEGLGYPVTAEPLERALRG